MDGLADESEGVRQAALAAGRTLVDLYALSALELLLPAVERGCAHENWRIRQSSVELLGDLLFKVSACLRTVPRLCPRHVLAWYWWHWVLKTTGAALPSSTPHVQR